MKNFNNLALGLGVAVLGYAVYQYMKSSSATATANATPNAAGVGANGAALWQNLTFPLGTMTGGTNNVGQTNVYSSTSYDPDSISAAISSDSQQALQSVYGGQAPLDSYGFTMPTSS